MPGSVPIPCIKGWKTIVMISLISTPNKVLTIHITVRINAPGINVAKEVATVGGTPSGIFITIEIASTPNSFPK